MFNHELFAVSFARTVHVMRQKPPVVDQQKAALRAVYALISIAPATVRVYDGTLSIDDVGMAATMPNVIELTAQMTAHGVAEIAIARGASPADLLALVRALAVEPGGFRDQDSVERRMRDSGATGIAVLSVQHADTREAGHRPASVTQAFELAALEEQEALKDWDRLHDASGVSDEKYAAFAPDEVAPEPAGDVAREPPAEPAEVVEEPARSGSLAAESETVAAGDELPVPADTALGRALITLRADPYGMAVLDHLSELGHAFQAAMAADQVWMAVRAVAAAIILEPGAPEGSPKNGYSIALRRMLTKDVLAQVAPLLLVDDEASAAAFVLHRAGSDGADVLLGLLATAETSRERKAYMNALRGIPQGTGLVVEMLNKPQWFVVRNVAELCGELRIEESVDELARLLGHKDPRVQRAAAVALAKIGSRNTVPPLLKLLKDGSPDLRGLVANAIGRKAAPALAMPIAALAADETSPDLLREYYCALGRIGTSEAVQALVKAAQPGGRLLSRRPIAVRLAAVEGLKLAGTTQAVTALGELRKDGDKSVATSARAAFEAASGL